MTGQTTGPADTAVNNNAATGHSNNNKHRPRVLGAILRASLCWFFLYVLVVHLFVWWSWDADDIIDHNDVLLQQQQQPPQLHLDVVNLTNASPLQLGITTTTAATESTMTNETDNKAKVTLPAGDELFDISLDETLEDEVEEDEEEDEEEEDLVDEVEEEIAPLEENEPRPPRVIEEEIVFLHLPDPYEQDKDEIEVALEDLQSGLDQLQAGLFEPLQSTLDTLNAAIENLVHSEPWTITLDGTTTTAHVPFLQQLLAVESLSEVSDEALYDLFENATQELKLLAANSATISWNEIEAIVNQPYPRIDANQKNATTNATTVNNDCPVLVLSEVNQSLARDADLNRQVQRLQTWLQNISQDLLHSIVLRTQPQQRHWEQTIAQLASHAKEERAIALTQEIESRNSGQNCITQEQVLDMVEEGLAALQQQPKPQNVQTLRAVLERKTKELEPETQVILDAIFLSQEQSQQRRRPPSSSWLTSTLATSESITLRQVLDTPLVTQQLPIWLDGLEKVVGGHLDVVDEFLDWLAQQPLPPGTTKASSASVGSLMVAHLLNVAAKVNITIPEALREVSRKQHGIQGNPY